MSIFKELWKVYEEEIQELYPISIKALLMSISPLGILDYETPLKLEFEEIGNKKKYVGYMKFKELQRSKVEAGCIYEIEANLKSSDSFVIKTLSKWEM